MEMLLSQSRRGGLPLAAIATVIAWASGGCAGGSSADRREAAAPRHGVLAVHVASEEPTEACTLRRPGPAGTALYLAPAPLITGEQVEDASASVSKDGQPAVVLHIDEAGSKAILDAAPQYVDRHLAFVWNDRVVYAPVAHDALSSRLMIVGGTQALPAGAVEQITAQFGDRGRGGGG